MTDIRIADELAERVAESVRHALRLVGRPDSGIEHEPEREESAVS